MDLVSMKQIKVMYKGFRHTINLSGIELANTL